MELFPTGVIKGKIPIKTTWEYCEKVKGWLQRHMRKSRGQPDKLDSYQYGGEAKSELAVAQLRENIPWIWMLCSAYLSNNLATMTKADLKSSKRLEYKFIIRWYKNSQKNLKMCTNVLFIKEENESMIRHPVTPIRKTIVMKVSG